MPNFSIYCCCTVNEPILWVGTFGLAARCGVVALDASINPIWQYRTNGQVARPNFASNQSGRMVRDDNYLYVPFVRNSSWEGTDGTSKSVAVLSLTDGSIIRMLDTGGNAVTTAVNSSGQVAVAGNQNNAWPGSGGTQASVWFYDSDGTLLWTYNTGGSTASCVIDNDGHVVVGGVFNATDNVHLWRINSGTGALMASMRVDTENDTVTSLDIGAGSTVCVVRPNQAPGNDVFEVPSNLTGVNNAAQKFNGNAAPSCAINTTPFSWLTTNLTGTLLRIEAGTTIDAKVTGLGSSNNVGRATTSPECWVTGSASFTANLSKITGPSLDTATNYLVLFDANVIGLSTVVQNKAFHV